jgi:hypothetical protein
MDGWNAATHASTHAHPPQGETYHPSLCGLPRTGVPQPHRLLPAAETDEEEAKRNPARNSGNAHMRVPSSSHASDRIRSLLSSAVHHLFLVTPTRAHPPVWAAADWIRSGEGWNPLPCPSWRRSTGRGISNADLERHMSPFHLAPLDFSHTGSGVLMGRARDSSHTTPHHTHHFSGCVCDLDQAGYPLLKKEGRGFRHLRPLTLPSGVFGEG